MKIKLDENRKTIKQRVNKNLVRIKVPLIID